jgi:glycosyltransferase involved in cell wall biosynthesis
MMGKKIVVLANGCDVRHYSMVEHDAREKGDNYHICFDCDFKQRCSLPLKVSRVRKIEKYADYIFAHPLTGYLFTKECLMPRLPIKLATVSYKLTSSADPLVVHAPSRRSKKGTRYLLGAVERLRNEGYQFKFMLCEKMNNEEVKKKLTESEIVVDQLLARAYGLFAVEAMASGNVVLGNAHPGRHGLPEDLPIATTNPSNIYEHLKLVLESPQLRLEKARQGRAYVEKYHDHVKVAKELLEKIGEVVNPQI